MCRIFFKSTNKKILEKECDKLALIYSDSMCVIDQAKKELTDIQSKKVTKGQQKKCRAQIKYNNLKRQRDEVLARI